MINVISCQGAPGDVTLTYSPCLKLEGQYVFTNFVYIYLFLHFQLVIDFYNGSAVGVTVSHYQVLLVSLEPNQL